MSDKNQLTEHEMRELSQARALNTSESILFPHIEDKIQVQIESMAAQFRAGNTNLLTYVASIVALMDMRDDLKRTQIQGNLKMAKLLEKENQK